MIKPSTFAYLGAFGFFVLALFALVAGQSVHVHTSAMILALILAYGYRQEGR